MRELICLARFENTETCEIHTHTIRAIKQDWFLECGDDDYPSIPGFIDWSLRLMMTDSTFVHYFKLRDNKELIKVTREYKEMARNNQKCPQFFKENRLFRGKYYMASIGWDRDYTPFLKEVYQDRLFDFDINTNIKRQENLYLKETLHGEGEYYCAFEQSLIQKTELGYQFID